MAQPLRKIFQKNLLPGAEAPAQGWREREGRARPQDGGRAGVREGRAAKRPRRTLDLSGAATAALGLALVAAVGWAFFMGYLVGRGEHPERGVESVAGLLRPGSPAASGAQPRKPLPGEEALQGAGAPEGAPAAASQAGPAGQAPPADESPQGAAPAGADASGTTAHAATAPEVAPAQPAYPFSRPQGEGLAAWGISEGAPAQAGGQAQAAGAEPAQAGAQAPGHAPARAAATAAPARAAAPPRQPAEPRFDYLFQAGAFKGPVDAERLRARLEGAGLRARVRPSGKVRLVLVSLRGSAEEAKRVREKLAGMGLGRPVQLEKKPVEEKPGGKGRRRSAP